ncbi:molybdenum cofactor guanylyltransferase [Oceanobacillus neutriphilus]|uniref:Probable molybdenum cofactor guanylyltransferase n=1 Tax=Oceanobacillus neutriphilus TaxID=531815 RepID=A0ABQ2P1I4_9BACI|nr:molybdenum cofactor guanylyltransferase [Oceanobacillus neutriphilus]GGP15843.1 putative molybdenum cofactor guanylyltransferase [Oceanobacillus neutriphilus]
MEKIAGILLAGGKSRRFGSPKAFLQMDGKYFYQYSVDSMREIVDSIVIVTNTELKASFHAEEDTFTIITDQKNVKGLGPLAGICTGMKYISADWYMTAPIDVPFINTAVFHTLLSYKKDGIAAIVPVVSGEIQPLIAIYHHSVKEVILDQLQKELLSAHQLLENLHVIYVPIEEERCFYNVNRREDYNRWIVDQKNENK